MKNKYIIILLTFVLSLVSFTLTKGEEFNFNTTELQITENGNIIKGKKMEMIKGIFSFVPKILKK